MNNGRLIYSLIDKRTEKNEIKKIRAVISIGIVIAVFLTVLFIVVPFWYFTSNGMIRKSLANTQTALKGFNGIIYDYQKEALNYAAAIALNTELKQYLAAENTGGISGLLDPLRRQLKIDLMMITDGQGKVIYQWPEPVDGGRGIEDQLFLNAALTGNSAAGFGRKATGGLLACAGVPIRDGAGRVRGAVITGFGLDKKTVVDQVKDLFRTDATLFMNDIRVATTISENGERVVGTRMNKDIAEIVLARGNEYVGPATILGTEYITAYQPLCEPDGKVVGALFAGQNLAVYQQQRNRMLQMIITVAMAAIVISIGIATAVSRKISKPLLGSVALLKENEEQFRQMFTKQQVMMWLVDPVTLIIIKANEAAQRFYGYSAEKFRNLRINDLVIGPVETVRTNYTPQPQSPRRLLTGKTVLANGEIRDVEIGTTFIKLETKEFFFDVVNDITERRQAEEHMAYLGFHDVLTGLYNRSYFERMIQQLDSCRQGTAGMIICDLDGLKMVNDTFGHERGDQMLLRAAKILKKCFGDRDIVARIGGDEFAAIMEDINEFSIGAAGDRIRRAINDYNHRNQDIPLSLSIGYALRTAPSISGRELYKEADNNMYREKLQQSKIAHRAIVRTVLKLLAARDFITEGHARRLQEIMVKLGRALGLPDNRLANLRLLSQFHDIGKVGIPDRILRKPGPLTPEETIEMRRHCEIGHRIARASNELAPVADLILKHQEWWDGSGYPLGLTGEAIPVECRILAIADAYDAMTSGRPYSKARSREEAVAELKGRAGTQFEPNLVELFCRIYKVKE